MKIKPNVIFTAFVIIILEVITLTACFSQQFARPSTNTVATEIVGSYTSIDEITASDADFLTSNNNTAAVYETILSSVTDPNVHTGHTIRVRISKANSNVPNNNSGNTVTLSGVLYQGATPIVTFLEESLGLWQTFSYTLLEEQAASITNYGDLRFIFNFSNSGGSPANRRGGAISWAEMEVPDPVAASAKRIFNIN